MPETKHTVWSRGGLLVGLHLVAAVTGYVVGARALVRSPTSEPRQAAGLALARVGLALADESPRGSAADWEGLRGDIATVRASFVSPQKEVFDLVVAVRGLENAGASDWVLAERRCRALGWPRCDRTALEELAKRSRP